MTQCRNRKDTDEESNKESNKESSAARVISLLKSVFKHEEFRGEQEKIISLAMSGDNSLVLMPTGTGKSLCYQMPAVAGEGLVLVISPLIALMQDQVTRARSLGIRAAAINSAMSKQDREERMRKLEAGHWQLLYVTPERFKNPEFVSALNEYQKKTKIQLLAIDEAHCISQWGHDFRPDYSRLGEFRSLIGSPPVMALTATATPAVQKDILKQLQMEDAVVFAGGIERPNLALYVHEVYGIDEKIRGMAALRHQVPGSAIFYFSLIQTLQKVSQELSRLSVPHYVYHGNLPTEVRHRNQKEFLQDKTDSGPLMLATPAFGLGVDKADVRLLVHAEIPNSVESYFQEVGRAGRDGKSSQCHLFFDHDDVSIQMEFIKWANPDPSFIRKVYQLIKGNPLQVEQQGTEYLSEQMNFYNKRDYRVETAVNLLERWGCLIEKRGPGTQNSRFPYSLGVEPTDDMITDAQVKQRIKTQNEKLLEMVRFASLDSSVDAPKCRMAFVLEYFGQFQKTCGICDLCQKTSPNL